MRRKIHRIGGYWDDLRVPTTSTRSAAGAPGFTKFLDNGNGSTGVFTDWFDASSVEQLYFEAQFPHDYIPGSDIHVHVHWVPSANGTAGQVVSWGIEYTWANIGTTYANTSIMYGNTHTPADANLVAGRHYITELGIISGVGKGISSMLIGRIFRDATAAGATDSYTADAGLIEIDFHYLRDGLGSRREYSK